MSARGCDVKGCPRPHSAKGFCAGHYQRRLNGLPLEGPFLPRPGRPKKSHCIRGHEFTPANTMQDEAGTKRRCRECHKIQKRAYRKTEKGKQARRRYLVGKGRQARAVHELRRRERRKSESLAFRAYVADIESRKESA